MTDNPPRRRGRGRRLLLVLGLLLAALAVALLFLPTILEAGPGKTIVRRGLEKKVDGTVELAALDLTWRGPQRATGVRIIDKQGRTAAELDVTLSPALLPLVMGSNAEMRVEVSGTVRGEIEPDGSTSLQRLPAPKPAAPRTTKPATEEPALSPTPLFVDLKALRIELRDARSGRELTIDPLAGNVSITPGGALSAKLSGPTRSGDLIGAIDLDAEAIGLVDDAGNITPRGATLRCDLGLRSVPVLFSTIASDLEALTIGVSSKDLTDSAQIEIDGSARIAGHEPASIEGRIAVAHPLDERGALSITPQGVSGMLKGQRLPTGILQPFLAGGTLPLQIERDIGPVLDLDATVVAGASRQFGLTLKAQRIDAQIVGRIDTDANMIEIAPSRLAATIAPELLAAVAPMLGAQALGITVSVQKATVPATADAGALSKALVDLTARLDTPVQVAVPSQEGVTLAVADVACSLRRTDAAAPLHASASATVEGAAASLEADLLDLFDAAGALTPSRVRPVGKLTISGVEQPLLVKLLPAQQELLSGLTMAPLTLAAETAAEGEGLRATATAGVESVALEPGKPAAQTVTLEGIGARADISRVLAALRTGGAFDLRALALDAQIDAKRVRVVPDEAIGPPATARQLRLGLTSEELSKGATVALDLESRAQGQETWQASQVRGQVSNLFDAEGNLVVGGARVSGTATIGGVPTALVDGLGDFAGLLVAALGPAIDGSAEAKNLSADSGSLAISVKAPNGSLNGSVRPRNAALRSVGEQPIQAELALSPELRQRLLARILPLLGDVRATEQPLRASVSKLVLPMDGDIGRLDADVEITLGAVELDSGSLLLGLLAAFDETDRATVPGYLEPIRATIRNGVVRYEPFALKIDKYTLAWSGTVNLKKGSVDLRTEIPLAGLAHSFQELEGYADQIVVPLVTRGSLDEPKTTIDPKFDLAKAASAAGFQGALGELSEKTGVPIGDILNELFKKKKKD